MALPRVHLLIAGLVQGVSYRASAQFEARRLGVRGWVRNLPSGEVESVAEAVPEMVEQFIAWCRRGPDEAQVESVVVTQAPAHAALPSDFEVRR